MQLKGENQGEQSHRNLKAIMFSARFALVWRWVIWPGVGRDGVCGFGQDMQNHKLPLQPGIAVVIAVVFCTVLS